MAKAGGPRRNRTGGGLGKALLAAAGLVAGAFVVRGAIQRAGRARAYLPQGIDDKGWMSLGGIDQWVTIRGRDDERQCRTQAARAIARGARCAHG